MAWYDESIFYHIYPLGLTGAPKLNDYSEGAHRLRELDSWADYVKELGCNAIYIGPLFESVGHGYETTDYYKLDSRLGDNDDLKAFVNRCHDIGIKVIFDAVFNHTGRDFFAFKDLKENRENSRYRDWFCNVNFGGNNEYNDGFCYDNWGGYNLLVKLNQRNPEVANYIYDVVRYWVKEFDVDGLRLDAADVMDFDFMKGLRRVANEVKEDFWLMGEVIHGEYSRWVNNETLHSVTNYHLGKALWSGLNEYNFFEIAHTVKRLYQMGGNKYENMKLYNFADNHDVERIRSKIKNEEHLKLVYAMMFTLPGVPSIYYGSEYGIEGEKDAGSDDPLRPALDLDACMKYFYNTDLTIYIKKLCEIRKELKPLNYGEYEEILLTNKQYVYSRKCDNQSVVVALNNDDADFEGKIKCPQDFDKVKEVVGLVSGDSYAVENGQIDISLKGNDFDILAIK